MNNPKVSIISPVYNFENFLHTFFQSILNQSYSNWELIIVDDNSSDSSKEIISYYKKNDPRIKAIFHTRRYGLKNLKKTYNEALSKATGEYIVVLEGDDFWPQNKLEIQVFNMEKNNSTASWGNWTMTSDLGTPNRHKGLSFKKPTLLTLPIILKEYSSGNLILASSTFMVKSRELKKIGGFRSDKNYPYIDIPTYLTILANYPSLYIPQKLGYYRRHSHSSWYANTKNSLNYLNSVFSITNTYTKKYTPQNIEYFHRLQTNRKNKMEKYKILSQTYHWICFDRESKYTSLKKILSLGLFASYKLLRIVS